MTTMTEQALRHLPTGSWKQTGPDTWNKLCGKCGGGKYLAGYEMIDGARCWGCMASGYAPGKALTTAELDRKEIADEKRAATRKAKRDAEAALHAANWKREEAARLVAEVAEAHTQALADNARINASTHLDAAEGDKVEVTGTVITAHTFEAVSYAGFGTDLKRIIAVDLGEGVTVKMFTQAGWAFDVERGDTVTIKATVKAHGDWQGVKETTLVRPRLAAHTSQEVAE